MAETKENRYAKFAEKRFGDNQEIVKGSSPEGKGEEKQEKVNPAPVQSEGKSKEEKKPTKKKKAGDSGSSKHGRKIDDKKIVTKNSDDNKGAIMFYLPEDVKLDLMIYAKKQKKSVALILRELVVEKLYS